jgi:hypothetical protein
MIYFKLQVQTVINSTRNVSYAWLSSFERSTKWLYFECLLVLITLAIRVTMLWPIVCCRESNHLEIEVELKYAFV